MKLIEKLSASCSISLGLVGLMIPIILIFDQEITQKDINAAIASVIFGFPNIVAGGLLIWSGNKHDRKHLEDRLKVKRNKLFQQAESYYRLQQQAEVKEYRIYQLKSQIDLQKKELKEQAKIYQDLEHKYQQQLNLIIQLQKQFNHQQSCLKLQKNQKKDSTIINLKSQLEEKEEYINIQMQENQDIQIKLTSQKDLIEQLKKKLTKQRNTLNNKDNNYHFLQQELQKKERYINQLEAIIIDYNNRRFSKNFEKK